MAGRVCVFNCFNESINQISVGGYAGGAIAAWGGSGAAMYQPQSIALPRIKHGDARTGPQFAVGDNPCQVAWDSWLVTVNVTVPSPGSVSLDDDLLLYVFVNQSVLVSTRGMVLGTFSNASGRNLA